ncbi:MAG: Alpha-L-fucosidase, partial [Bacteroidota bacterium]
MKNQTAFLPAFFLLSLLFHHTLQAQLPQPLKLWYSQPATHFEETLLIGNGRQGAIIYGGVNKEKIHLNDLTLWSGEPVNPYMNPTAHQYLPKVREALAREDYRSANELLKNIQGKFSESYAPLGTLQIEFPSDTANTYYRELDIENATAKVEYNVNGQTTTREYFYSYPDNAMAVRMHSSKKGGLNFTVSFRSLLKYNSHKEGNALVVDGYAPVKADPHYTDNKVDAVVFDPAKGTRFAAQVAVKSYEGIITLTDSNLQV